MPTQARAPQCVWQKRLAGPVARRQHDADTHIVQAGMVLMPKPKRRRPHGRLEARCELTGLSAPPAALHSSPGPKPDGFQVAGFVDAQGVLWPPGCGRSRARTRGGGAAKVAERALETANTLAETMKSHVELQRETLRASSSKPSQAELWPPHAPMNASFVSCLAGDEVTFRKRQRKW